MKQKDLEKLDDALFNRAIGFSKDEVTEEYSMVEDKLTLIKKKLNTKYYPPELKAIEMVMEKYGLNKDDTYENYDLLQLEKEREKLLKMLKEAQEKNSNNDRKSEKKK